MGGGYLSWVHPRREKYDGFVEGDRPVAMWEAPQLWVHNRMIDKGVILLSRFVFACDCKQVDSSPLEGMSE